MTEQEIQGIKELSNHDIELILRDQRHLYSAEELLLIQGILEQKSSSGRASHFTSNVFGTQYQNETESTLADSIPAIVEDESELDEETETRVQFVNRNPGIMTTSGYHFEGYFVLRHLGFISCEEVLGTGFLSEFTAAWSDTFGTRSVKMSNKLATVKNAVFNRLVESCMNMGANAILGITINMMTLSNNMMVASASGTAVEVAKNATSS